MLYEKPIAALATASGLVIVVPEAVALLQQPSRQASAALLVGGVLGAAGIYLGAAVLQSSASSRVRLAGLAGGFVLALLFAAALGIGLRQASSGLAAVSCAAVGLLPLVGVLSVFLRGRP